MTALPLTIEGLSDPPPVTFTRMSGVKARPLVYAWDKWVPMGALTLLAGREGTGKSLLMARLMADLTLGTLPGILSGAPTDVLLVGTEDGVEEVWKPRLVAAGADLDRVLIQPMVEGNLLTLYRNGDLALMGRYMHGCRAVFLDHLSAVLPPEASVKDYGDMGRALRMVNEWAHRYQVAAMGNWHLNKSDGPLGQKVLGSVALRSSVRSLITMAAHPQNEGDVWLALDKANGTSTDVPARGFHITSVDVEVDGHTINTGLCPSVQTMDHPGSGRDYLDYLAAWHPEWEHGDGERKTAVQWLDEYLAANGQTPKVLVVEEGTSRGYSSRSVEAAAESLRCVRHRLSGNRVAWSLPEKDEQDG